MALKQDPVYLCPSQGNKIESVVIRECTLVFFLVVNRVRVSNPQRLTYTQILVEYPQALTVWMYINFVTHISFNKASAFHSLGGGGEGYSLIWANIGMCGPKGCGFCTIFVSKRVRIWILPRPFWSGIGYCFRGNYGSVWTYLSRERVICVFDMDCKKSFRLSFSLKMIA